MQVNVDTMNGSPLELSLIIPAYNEELRLGQNLGPMWRGLRRRFSSFELIVVDDGSTDGTARVVEDFASEHPEVRLIRYDRNRGKGYAVRCGVLSSRGNWVLFSDADQSTPLREVGKLLKALEESDIAIGSRAVRDAHIIQSQPFYRMMMGKTFNKMVQLLAVPGILDTQCGFKCFRGTVARQLFSCCRIDGFSFDVEALFIARRMGLRVKEVGVLWRNSPESRVHPIRHSLQMFRDLIRIRFYVVRGCYLDAHALKQVRTET